MIRRDAGERFWLITQPDHAAISATLAAHLGNHLFNGLDAQAVALRAIALHDAGWAEHDAAPTLNPEGLPVDVFESPSHLSLPIWAASADRAAEADPYAGLLVSLHSLALSINATSKTGQEHEKHDVRDPTRRFAVNKFQHREIERQESLRKTLGMRTDLPLLHGLAQDSKDVLEQALVFHFRLLQAMDQVSLAICCTHPPGEQIRPLLARPGGRELAIRVSRSDATTVHLSPWPFAQERVTVRVPYRAVRAGAWQDEAEFRESYRGAPVEEFVGTVARM